ncbi:MAG: 4Fe-4S dicluster domain-containing protein [Kiritimatiellae bacterium]|nr:4Fe-4S dicluster domain-containing protein [Kiritimatiellia bacterium]
MPDAQKQLREIAKKLFDENRITFLIGYEQGTLPDRSRPCFISGADEVEKLIWNSTCSNNLMVYLVDYLKKKPARRDGTHPKLPNIGIVTKGCDALSLALLIKEHQVSRENLVVIGVPCMGIVDPDTKTVMTSCLECSNPVPHDTDFLINGESRQPATERFTDIEEFEAKSPEERWAYFKEQLSKCIKCHACREACPNCYCVECFADETDPKWLGAENTLSNVMMYHIGRMFHQAGRCVGCDACVRACPMNVDLRIFTHKLVKDAKELFDYELTESLEEKSLLCTFDKNDSDNFITDPDNVK